MRTVPIANLPQAWTRLIVFPKGSRFSPSNALSNTDGVACRQMLFFSQQRRDYNRHLTLDPCKVIFLRLSLHVVLWWCSLGIRESLSCLDASQKTLVFLWDRCVFKLETVHNSAEHSIFSLAPGAKTKNDPLQNSDDSYFCFYHIIRSPWTCDQITDQGFSDTFENRMLFVCMFPRQHVLRLYPRQQLSVFQIHKCINLK